ncbi:MAG: hypothetical protein LRZ87_03600 [Methanocellales archaeon]|nr:hypothetical protein [Methanocellales archaeon]
MLQCVCAIYSSARYFHGNWRIGLAGVAGNREFTKHVIIGSSMIIITSLAMTVILLLA